MENKRLTKHQMFEAPKPASKNNKNELPKPCRAPPGVIKKGVKVVRPEDFAIPIFRFQKTFPRRFGSKTL